MHRYLIAAGLALALTPTAHAAVPAPDVPEQIRVEAGHKPFLAGHATGVQIYRCNAGGWGLLAPRAELRDERGNLLTTHYGGPTWEARDGSKVIAARDGGVTPDPTAIPWLRLKATSTSAGPDGDRLAGTTFIQRIATTGGLMPPAGECGALNAGEVREVPYTADYVFWKAHPSS